MIDAMTEGQSQFVEISQDGPVLTASLIGPSIGERDASIIDTDVTAAIEKGGASVQFFVLDLRRVEFMPSAGIGMCINLQKRAKSAGGTPVVYGLTSEMQKIFKMMNLHKVFKIVDDSAALAKVIKKR